MPSLKNFKLVLCLIARNNLILKVETKYLLIYTGGSREYKNIANNSTNVTKKKTSINSRQAGILSHTGMSHTGMSHTGMPHTGMPHTGMLNTGINGMGMTI